MLTIIEFAHLAFDIYQDHHQSLLTPADFTSLKKNNSGQYTILYKDAVQILHGFYRMTDVDTIQHPTNPFFCQLYIKFNRGKATHSVVSYRGTANWDNRLVDIKSWNKDVLYSKIHQDYLPKYADFAAIYYAKSRQYLKQHFPEISNKLTYATGHSLGGALAALTIVRCAFPGLAITFNAPGIAEMPAVDKELFSRVYNIQARYDFISKIGEQCRPAIYVDVFKKEAEAKAAFEHWQRANVLEQAALAEHNILVASAEETEATSYEKVAMVEFAVSADAQHSMYNLWSALSEQSNSAVAHQMPV